MLAAAWAGAAISLLRSAPGARSTVLGIFLLFLATAMLLLVVSAARANPLFSVLVAARASRFALTGAYQVTGATGLERAAGWIGVPLLALCLYGNLALLLEEGAQRTILPLGRRGRARAWLEGDIGHQIEHAEQEPGPEPRRRRPWPPSLTRLPATPFPVA